MSWFSKKKKSDWMLLHALKGDWRITSPNGDYDDYCSYEIYYSPSADKIDIKMDGYKPKGHSMYNSVMKIVGMYNEAILKDEDFSKIKKYVDTEISKVNKK